ncbi:MAG: FAD-binding oxidoreductase [Nanoarchaeota archaeon]|nr:FAD-binding oxidoreductase [Nanoarchaeota archaeon]MBU4086131.1 FAD-binding oxidoreductase [Nanoarchaeota archaeon]
MKEKKQIDLIAYSTDASMIEGNAISIIFPESVEKIQEAVRNFNGITIRGGGSGLVGGAVPQNCVVLDMSKMSKILKFDLAKRDIEVEAGIILDELNSYLDKHGLEFPVNPSSHSICTIGGMIATNAVGSRAIKYGRTSDWVSRVWVIDGRGEVIEAGKTEIDDFSGLEGITGVIFKARLKLIPKMKRTASLVSMSSLSDVQGLVMNLKLREDVSAIEFFDRFISGLLNLPDSNHLIVEYESEEGKMKGEDYIRVMNLRDNIYPTLASAGFTHIEDPKILIHKFSEFAEFLQENKIPFFGHVGSGIIHPVYRKGQESLIRETIKLTKKLHGQVSGEHGIGLSKKEFLEPGDIKIIERIKKRRDPLNKLNCGKVIDLKPQKKEEEKKLVDAADVEVNDGDEGLIDFQEDTKQGGVDNGNTN